MGFQINNEMRIDAKIIGYYTIILFLARGTLETSGHLLTVAKSRKRNREE
jgi:hypothetical protein